MLRVARAEQEQHERPIKSAVARVHLGGDAGELEHCVYGPGGRPRLSDLVEALERVVEQRVENTALRADEIIRRDEAHLGLLRETEHRELGAAGRAYQPPRGVENLLATLALVL